MLVSFDHVYLRYGAHKPVLHDISFDIEAGSFLFLTGPSGAGKSSLLRLIYGVNRPTEGRIALFGKNTAELDRDSIPAIRRRLGFVFQDFRLIPHLTALENVALPLGLAGGKKEQVRGHVTELLRWVGLGDRVNALPSDLSGGEQQRVAIARAIINKPRLLLADEPTGNVDHGAALKLLRLFVELNKMGTAVLLATHQQGLVEQLGFPALHLTCGHLVTPVAQAA
jgi:cell division transport system ATP-binding protein